MSKATLRPAAFAARIALRLMASTAGVEKCVPVTTTAAGAGDETLVHVRFRQAHVGAVLPVEDQREVSVVEDAEHDERGQPLPVDLDAVRAHALPDELLPDEAAHVLVADAR